MAIDYFGAFTTARAARESAEAHQRPEETEQPDAAENETEKAEG